jgi:tetraacyldisaccharide 4'-kinase
MNRVKDKIFGIMHGENHRRYSFLAVLLYALSKGYGGLVHLRRLGYRKRLIPSKKLPCMVISIGNLTVGGTGKTPMAIYLARTIQGLGHRVVVVSRGYKGAAEKSGGIVSDGESLLMGYKEAGDEPLMLAKILRGVPVLVGSNRYQAGRVAVKQFNPNIVILDDGFQHLALQRDIDLVLLDANLPLGNTHLLPRGTLREPISALKRGNAFILTRTSSDSGSQSEVTTRTGWRMLKSITGQKPIFRSTHVSVVRHVIRGDHSGATPGSHKSREEDAQILRGKRVIAFAGIAANSRFKRELEQWGCLLETFIDYTDHHSYSRRDIDHIVSLAEATGVDFVVTTEKDYMRIIDRFHLPLDMVVMGIKISMGDDEKAFEEYLQKKIEAFSGGSH